MGKVTQLGVLVLATRPIRFGSPLSQNGHVATVLVNGVFESQGKRNPREATVYGPAVNRKRRLHAHVLLPIGLAVATAGLSVSGAGADVLQLPNLVPLAPYEIHVDWADDAQFFVQGDPLAIRFSVSTMNRGAYAMELFGDPDATTLAGFGPAERTAYQCVWWASRICTHHTPVGTFVWHDAHSHWHFEKYALYELRRLGSDGMPNMAPAGLVTPGRKASFCLLDIWQTGEAPPGHDPLASIPVYQTCTDNIQGISPGWADEYGWHLEGQQIPLKDIPDGTYALVITVNPDRLIFESDLSDNAAFTVVTISDGGRKVTCPARPQLCTFSG